MILPHCNDKAGPHGGWKKPSPIQDANDCYTGILYIYIYIYTHVYYGCTFGEDLLLGAGQVKHYLGVQGT